MKGIFSWFFMVNSLKVSNKCYIPKKVSLQYTVNTNEGIVKSTSSMYYSENFD